MNFVKQDGNTIIASNEHVIINGQILPRPSGKGCSITTINNKIYINGYEYKDGRWKRSLAALWHWWF